MASKKIFSCDRCGVTAENVSLPPGWEEINMRDFTQYEMCSECIQAFFVWVANK